MGVFINIVKRAIHEDGPVLSVCRSLFWLCKDISPHAFFREWGLSWAVLNFNEALVDLVFDIEEPVVNALGLARAGTTAVSLEKNGTLVVLFDNVLGDSVVLGFNKINRPNDLWEHVENTNDLIFSRAAALIFLFNGFDRDCVLSQ